jgi:hypothetical protein
MAGALCGTGGCGGGRGDDESSSSESVVPGGTPASADDPCSRDVETNAITSADDFASNNSRTNVSSTYTTSDD